MRKILSTLLIFISFFGCTVRETPEFVMVDQIEIKEASITTLTLSGRAHFKNPNDIGGTLHCEGIAVSVNDIPFGTLSSEAFKVPIRDTFSIPLAITISTKALAEKNSSGLLAGILNSVLTKKIDVHYTGVIKYKALGFTYDYPIDIIQEVKIKE